jgi:hypothetical protein
MPFRARPGAIVALAFCVATIAFASSAAAAANPSPAPSSGTRCKVRGFPSPSPRSIALRGGPAHASITPGAAAKGLTKFLLEKAVGVQVERYALMGMNKLLTVIGLKSLSPTSPEQAVLRQLQAINARLDQIETRIGGVGDRVNQLIREHREKAFDDELLQICAIANSQMTIYTDYKEAVESGLRLGALLNKEPAKADIKDFSGSTPREVAAEDVKEFIDQYKANRNKFGEQIGTLRNALVPRDRTTWTALRRYGLVLMARERFLTRADSTALRDLYREISEIHALTSWMEAEYWTALGRANRMNDVINAFVEDDKAAEAALPEMIPHGVVVDVGKESPSTADGRQMWFAPVSKDLGWLPPIRLNHRTYQIDEVDHVLDQINDRRFTRHNDWHAPRNQEFRALISDGCSVDPRDPAKALTGCRNAVPGGHNIAAYLAGVNPTDAHWQQLFCQRSVNPKCPAGAGPTAFRQPPHAFVWTSDIHSQRLLCGKTLAGEFAIRLNTHAGYYTLGPIKHTIFPHFPMRIPNPVASKHEWNVEEGCAAYLRGLIGDQRLGIKRNHLFEGVLLATRFTDAVDLNKLRLDYMAQPAPGH